MKTVNDIRLPLGSSDNEAIEAALKTLNCGYDCRAVVSKKSIDARRQTVSEVYSVSIYESGEADAPFYDFSEAEDSENLGKTVYIIGFGPAGMFAAYLLSLAGFNPVVAERGEEVAKRSLSVEAFLSGGALNEDSNVQYGEGGAGTFSDGKLTTRIGDPRCRFVLRTLYEHGAPEDILYKARPHIGTDILRNVVTRMREDIIRRGGKVICGTKMTDIDIGGGKVCGIYFDGCRYDTDTVIAATGNGARDTYAVLMKRGVTAAAKPFSVGVRMEFLQEDLNRAVYGKNGNDPRLPPAEYNFFTHFGGDKTNTVYTFCMCPGGQVINSSSEKGYLVTNGMSFHARGGVNANSALLASVSFGTPEEGIEFQRKLERAAFLRGNGYAPVTLAEDFLEKRKTTAVCRINPTFRPGFELSDLYSLFPEDISSRLASGLREFNKKVIKCGDAVLTGAETRTSAPLRLNRNIDTLEAIGCKGLYPCGEGSGYSGGIVSSAADGLRAAEAVIRKVTGKRIFIKEKNT